MEIINEIVTAITSFISTYIMPQEIQIIALLGTGLFLTIRLLFVQLRHFGHGVAVATGRYDDPNEPGDVSHFQALTTALSATVGVGNIAGVALALHFGGPGALFWMWMTAFFGMAVKYSEVTLALKYRHVEEKETKAWEGSVSGGPMYYIEKGLGKNWKPLAIFFATMLMISSFLTGNAVQANTISDLVSSKFGIPSAVIGLVTAAVVGMVIFGGISRIGKVTSILAPAMAVVYVLGAVVIIFMNFGEVPAAFGSIFAEAFNPTAGIAGAGAGAFMHTLQWGVARGLFSNEAGQGSAPIAHAAAKTDEPVSEGVVALLEPFIDTLVICTLTGLVLLTTGAWNSKIPTEMTFPGDLSFVQMDENGIYQQASGPDRLNIVAGELDYKENVELVLAWHEAPMEKVYTDPELTQLFTGVIHVAEAEAVTPNGDILKKLYTNAYESGAPMTMVAFSKHLGLLGEYIVILCVALFAVSTAISWSYYGDRCASYVFGKKAIIPYKLVYIVFHFIGAIASLEAIWGLGDVALSIVIIPNLLALWLLSKDISQTTNSYFERKPWKGQPKH